MKTKTVANALEQAFRLKSRLKYKAEEMGLPYYCNVIITGYSPKLVQKEDGETYTYPECLEIKIEAHSNHFYSIRTWDCGFVHAGVTLGVKGLTTAQVYSRILRELKAHAASVQARKVGAV